MKNKAEKTEVNEFGKNWLKTFRFIAKELDDSDTTVLNVIDPEQFDAPDEPVLVNKRFGEGKVRFDEKKLMKIKEVVMLVSEYLGCTPLQSVTFVALFAIQVGERDQMVDIDDLQRFFGIDGINTFPILNTIKELRAKHYVSMKRSRNSENYFINAEIVNAIMENKQKFQIKEQEKIDRYDFCKIVSDMIEERDSTDSLFRDVEVLEEENPQVQMIKKLVDMRVKIADRTLFYEICDDSMQARSPFQTTNIESTLNDIYDRTSARIKVARQLMDETNALQVAGLIEKGDGGFFNDSNLELTEKGKEFFLEDDIQLFSKKKSSKKLINVDKIPEKQLYFEDELSRKIAFLENSLQEKNFKKLQERLVQKSLPKGVAAIFYGAPGTGKTETVMQMARRTGRKVYHVDISASKSCWFGESEKIIKRIFTDYAEMCKNEDVKPILLLNEADALFSKRKEGNASNVAQTENAIQNIILEELEKLEGILIATTNLADNLDAAFERRFLFKIEFEKPSEKAQMSIWQNRLPGLAENDYRILARTYQFSGGEIENIVRKATMNEVLSDESVNLDFVLQLCRDEKLKRGSYARIGFSA